MNSPLVRIVFWILALTLWYGPGETRVWAADTVPPVTTATPSTGSYYNSVKVYLTRSEPASTYYCLGSGCSPTTPYAGPLTFTTTTVLRFYSRDPAGNVEAIRDRTYTIVVDKTAPVTTITPEQGTYYNAITVILTRSEPASTYYCLGSNCTPTTPYTGALTFTSTTVIRYYSKDPAGNREANRTRTYTIVKDTTPPVTTISPTPGSYSGSVTVTFARSEAGYTYYCTGASCSPTTPYTGALTYSATTTIRYYSKDKAGNSETIRSATYTITASNPHIALTWSTTTGYKICLNCHASKASEVFSSVHYQWLGSGSKMVNGGTTQGKLTTAVNAYCVNILGNFSGCGSCHTGLGATPSTTYSQAQAENIDCLLCHQKDYVRKKNATSGLYEPDTAKMTITMTQAIRTVHTPVRSNCLSCHAKAGGGDAVKRGDLALATGATSDLTYDRHMAQNGANHTCQSCHAFNAHKVAGRGSDLRPLDSTAAIGCTSSSCHAAKPTSTGHTTSAVNTHVNRVACQSCHLPTYAKNASDSTATEATETSRDWRTAHYNSTLLRYEPSSTLQNNLVPKYRHYNGTSWGYSNGDVVTYDSVTGAYQVSRPQGSITDTATTTKLYPFKYKTAYQPMTSGLAGGDKLILLSTKDYFATGVYDTAVKNGLTNMGLPSSTLYTTVMTDEYQLLNHQIAPKASVLACTSCHLSSTATQVKLNTLGYTLKKTTADLCNDCHSLETYTSTYSNFLWIHEEHVDEKNQDCSSCHGFSRPER